MEITNCSFFGRRKKKCVRVQAYLDKQAANGGGGAPGQQNHLGQPNSHGGNPAAFGNNNKYVSSINGSNHSDSGSDADTDDDDDDMEDGRDRDGGGRGSDRSNKGSLESTSEQSLTSPASEWPSTRPPDCASAPRHRLGTG